MAKPSQTTDMTGDEALAFVARIKEVNAEIIAATLDHAAKADAAKAAKARKEALHDELSDLITRSAETLADKPLFNQEGPAATTPAPAQVAVHDAWKGEPITVLLEHGLTDSICDKLTEGGIKTLGDLADCSDLTAIKGIGAKAAEKIADAATAYHTSGRDQAEDEDTEDEQEQGQATEPAEGGVPPDAPRPFLVHFTRKKARRHVVYARSEEEALHYAADQLTFVDSVTQLGDRDVEDTDVVAHVPDGYGAAEASAEDEQEPDELAIEPDPDALDDEPDEAFDEDDEDDQDEGQDEDDD